MGRLKAPRVLVIGTVLGQAPGGVRRHNQELLPRVARMLESAGGSLSVLEGREPCAFELPEFIERIPSAVPAGPALRRSLAEGHELRRLLRKRQTEGRPFDLVHTAHQPVPRGFETPISLLIHDLRSLDLSHSPFSRRLFARELIGRAAHRAAAVSTVSSAMADQLSSTLGIGRELIRVIANAADHLAPSPRRSGQDAPLLCVGHIEPRKNLQLVLKTLAHDPALPNLVIIGAAKGKEQQRLQSLASSLAIEDRVRFRGAVDQLELEKNLAECACVVLPSKLEGFGIVALEAEVAAAPLAVSSIPAHLEVVPQAEHFANTPGDCALAIRRALTTSPEQLQDRSALARERFTWDDSAARLFRTWCEIHEGSPAQ